MRYGSEAFEEVPYVGDMRVHRIQVKERIAGSR